jgi:hypothetical protein
MRYPGYMFNVISLKCELNGVSAYISFSSSDLMTVQPFAIVWSCLLHKIRNGRLWLATTMSDNRVYRNLENKKQETCHISFFQILSQHHDDDPLTFPHSCTLLLIKLAHLWYIFSHKLLFSLCPFIVYSESYTLIHHIIHAQQNILSLKSETDDKK